MSYVNRSRYELKFLKDLYDRTPSLWIQNIISISILIHLIYKCLEISSGDLCRANTWIWASPGTLCKRYNDIPKSNSRLFIAIIPYWLTGGLTNHAVSHSFSFHLRLTNVATSSPIFLIISSSSSVPLVERIRESSVMPHSERAGRAAESPLGEGGGPVSPANPQRPSCRRRWAIDGGSSGGSIGSRVQISECSISGGTKNHFFYQLTSELNEGKNIPEYGQSFMMILISSGGVSAVK